MGKINGNDFVITAATTDGGTQNMFLHANSGTYESTNAVIEATTKDSNSQAEFISGRLSRTISVDGLLDYSGDTMNTLNTVELRDLHEAGSTFFWAMSGDDTDGTGKVTYSGSAISTSYSETGNSDEVAAYSMSFQVTGVVTKTVAA